MSSRSLHALRTLVASEIAVSDYTQAGLCDLLGISEKHLSQFLVGHCGMSLALVDRLLHQLGRRLILATVVDGSLAVDTEVGG